MSRSVDENRKAVLPILIIVQLWLIFGTILNLYRRFTDRCETFMRLAGTMDGIKSRWQELVYHGPSTCTYSSCLVQLYESHSHLQWRIFPSILQKSSVEYSGATIVTSDRLRQWYRYE